MHLQNTETSQSLLRVNQSLLYSLTTSGTGTESISMFSALERQNAQGTWDIIGITSFSIGNDASNSACTPACSGVSGYAMGAGDTWTLRLRTRLLGNMAQPVPEPGALALAAAALGALALVHRRRARTGPVLSAS